MAAWVFFRAATFGDAGAMLGGMIGLNGLIAPDTIDAVAGQLQHAMGRGSARELADALAAGLDLLLLAFGVVVVLISPNTQQLVLGQDRDGRAVQHLVHWRPSIAWAGALALGLLFSLTQLSQVKVFVYFQF